MTIKPFSEHPITLERDNHGVFHIFAETDIDLYRGLGYAHALDRGLQLQLLRVLAQGQACQLLDDTDAMLEVDCFFRRMAPVPTQEELEAQLDEHEKACLQAYCQGVTVGQQKHFPLELKLLGIRPEPWDLPTITRLSRITGYVSLAQSQQEAESLLVQLVRQGVDQAHLEELFGPLPELDLELIRQLKSAPYLIPPDLPWNPYLPTFIASNNWVIAGHKSASGCAMLANDPHLEGNRLPNVWYEVVWETPDRYAIATTMPGLPGLLLGRTPDLAWGATYTFMDAIDSWVEDCQNGQYRRADQWIPFQARREIIQRKHHPPHELWVYENEHGLLQGDPHDPGLYLAIRWSGAQSGIRSLKQSLNMFRLTEVAAGMNCLGQIETAWNWVLADRHGNIGYQMSGLLPRRREGVSGVVPLPGWLPENDWQGFATPAELPRSLNPWSGYLVTANQDLNALGQVKAINMPMGGYRAERIQALLNEPGKRNVKQMQAIQLDTFSLQAEPFLNRLKPLLPNTPAAKELQNWDRQYTPDSFGAYRFECFYQALLEVVFGSLIGAEPMDHLLHHSPIITDFFANFDRILLAEASLWFGTQSWAELYQQAFAKADRLPSRRWGEVNQMTLRHLLLGGKLPTWVGFDHGPIAVPGGRATPWQGQLYHQGERQTSYIPSFRLVTDFAEAASYTCLLGGPSDRRTSRWYKSEIKNWQKGHYKKIVPKGFSD